MKLRLLTLTLILLLTGSTLTMSQTGEDNPLMPVAKSNPIYIGPVAGFNRSLHSVELKTFADDALCPTFINGAANGFFAGLSIEFPLGNVVGSKSSIIGKALYNSLPVSLSESGKSYPSRLVLPDGNESVVTSTVDHVNEVTYNIVTLETFYKLNLLNTGFGVFVGPTFDFALSKDYNQTMNLIDPSNAKFKRDPNRTDITYTNNDRTIVIKDGEIPDSNPFRLGIKAGVQYEILMGSFYLVPHVSYNLGVTDLSGNEDWRVNALQIGADLRYALNLF